MQAEYNFENIARMPIGELANLPDAKLDELVSKAELLSKWLKVAQELKQKESQTRGTK